MAASNAELSKLVTDGAVSQDASGNWLYSYMEAGKDGKDDKQKKLRLQKHNDGWLILTPTPPDLAMAAKMMNGLHTAAVYYTASLKGTR